MSNITTTFEKIDPVEALTKYNSQWVEFHIRDHLENGEISIRHTVIEGHALLFLCPSLSLPLN